ncbi:MAG TPA: hypothetical protein VJP77_04155 [Planctomycetota bacterium]|nr:hypothetical protein [Planctomycetota bacterium]
MRSTALRLVVLVGAATPALPQTEILIAQGDVLPGVGTVADVAELALDGNGHWAATVHLATPGFPQALVVDGAVLIAWPTPLPGVAGNVPFVTATSLAFDAGGELVWIANGLPVIGQDGVALYRGLTPLLRRDDLVVAPGVTPGTQYDWFVDARPGGPGEVVAHVIADDAAIQGITDNMLLRVVDQPGGGVVVTDLVKRGDVLPGQTTPVQEFTEYGYGLAANASGAYLHVPRMSGGPEAVYLELDPLAISGTQSPYFGEPWGAFNRVPVALNDAGDYAFGARVGGGSATLRFLVWNGIVVVEEGEPLAAVAPFAIDRLYLDSVPYASPLHLTDDGRIAWFGGWNDPDPTSDQGLFLDHELVLDEGVPYVDGLRVTDFFPTGPGAAAPHFDVTPAGDQFALRAGLEDGRIAAVRIRPGGSVTEIASCTPNAGTLTSAPQSPGSFLFFNAGNAQAVGALALVGVSAAQVTGTPPCGIVLPGLGEQHIALDPANLLALKPGLFPATAGLSTVVFFSTLPTNPTLAGVHLYAQGLWIDPSPTAPEPLRATNALDFELGQ